MKLETQNKKNWKLCSWILNPYLETNSDRMLFLELKQLFDKKEKMEITLAIHLLGICKDCNQHSSNKTLNK